MAVYSPGENEYTEVAREIATDRGEELVDDLAALGDGDVIYVDSPEAISEAHLLTLQQRLLENGPDSGGFGVITGYTPDEARKLYYRDEMDNGTDALLSQGSFAHSLTDESTVTLVDGDMNIETLNRYQEGRLRSLGIRARGWNMHLNLAKKKGGFICGFPKSLDADAFEGEQPFCVQDGEMDCPFDTDIVHAEDIDVSHAFVSSCASMIDNDLSGLPVHVGMGLLSSATSLIGSYKVSPTSNQELLLQHSAFRSGYSAVERCNLLNENAHALNVKAFPYVPFGEPRHGIEPARSEYDVSYHREDGDLVVECSDVDTFLIDVTVPADTFTSETGEYYVEDIQEQPNDRLRHTVFPVDDGVRLLVFTGDRISTDSLRLRLGDRPVDYERRLLIQSHLQNAEAVNAMGIFSTKGKRQLRNLRNSVHSFTGELYREGQDPNTYRELADRTETMLHQAKQIGERILKGYHSRPNVSPMHTYGHRFKATDTYPSDITCPRCGKNIYIVESSTIDGSVRRATGLCSTDGNIFDVPIPEDGSPLYYPRIRSDLVAADEEQPTLTVEFENPHDHPVDVSVNPFLPVHPREREGQAEVFDPLVSEQRLQPGEKGTFDVEIDTSSLHPGQYIVHLYVLVNLELYQAGTMLTTGGETGFVVGKLRE